MNFPKQVCENLNNFGGLIKCAVAKLVYLITKMFKLKNVINLPVKKLFIIKRFTNYLTENIYNAPKSQKTSVQ